MQLNPGVNDVIDVGDCVITRVTLIFVNNNIVKILICT